MTLFHEIKTYLDFHPSDVTVILPFEGQQNIEIEEMIERLRPDAMFIDDLMLKLSVDYVREMILPPGSYFRQFYCTTESFCDALHEFDRQSKRMGDFYRTHLMNDYEIRSVVEQVIRTEYPEVAKYFDSINGKDILYIIGEGDETEQLVKTAKRELKRHFSPRSVRFLAFRGQRSKCL